MYTGADCAIKSDSKNHCKIYFTTMKGSMNTSTEESKMASEAVYVDTNTSKEAFDTMLYKMKDILQSFDHEKEKNERIKDLENQLKLEVEEKKLWMQKYKDMFMKENVSIPLFTKHGGGGGFRKRTNSELRFMADIIAQPGSGIIESEIISR